MTRDELINEIRRDFAKLTEEQKHEILTLLKAYSLSTSAHSGAVQGLQNA